jgi:hypothetical protein
MFLKTRRPCKGEVASILNHEGRTERILSLGRTDNCLCNCMPPVKVVYLAVHLRGALKLFNPLNHASSKESRQVLQLQNMKMYIRLYLDVVTIFW